MLNLFIAAEVYCGKQLELYLWYWSSGSVCCWTVIALWVMRGEELRFIVGNMLSHSGLTFSRRVREQLAIQMMWECSFYAFAFALHFHCINESIQCWMSLAAPLMQLRLRFICVSHVFVFAFALSFRLVHVAIENANTSLTQLGKYVTRSDHFRSLGGAGANPSGWLEMTY